MSPGCSFIFSVQTSSHLTLALYFLISFFAVLTGQWSYIIDVVVNVSDVETFERIRPALSATSLPIQLDNNTEISDISITTGE